MGIAEGSVRILVGVVGGVDLGIAIAGAIAYDFIKRYGPPWLRKWLNHPVLSDRWRLFAIFLGCFILSTLVLAPYWQFQTEHDANLKAEAELADSTSQLEKESERATELSDALVMSKGNGGNAQTKSRSAIFRSKLTYFSPKTGSTQKPASEYIVGTSEIDLLAVHNLFLTDFIDSYPNIVVHYAVGELSINTHHIEAQVRMSYDLNANAKYLSCYVPSSPDTFVACMFMSTMIPQYLTEFDDSKKIEVAPVGGEIPEETKDCIFTGKVYIYYEGTLTFDQLSQIEKAYKDKGYIPQLRGNDYAATVYTNQLIRSKEHPDEFDPRLHF